MKRLIFVVFCAVWALSQVFAQAQTQAQASPPPAAGYTTRGAASQRMTVEGFYGAHPVFPLNSRVIITNPRNGKEAEITIIDRIDPSLNRIIDLSPFVMQYLELKDGEQVVVTVNMPPVLPPILMRQGEGAFVDLPEKK